MTRLERLQLDHEAVVLGVGNRGLVEHVVAVIVCVDLVAQLVRAFGSARRTAGLGHAQASPAARACGGASSDWRRREMRGAVSSSPCWSVITPSRRSASERAAPTSTSNASGSASGPGNTAN